MVKSAGHMQQCQQRSSSIENEEAAILVLPTSKRISLRTQNHAGSAPFNVLDGLGRVLAGNIPYHRGMRLSTPNCYSSTCSCLLFPYLRIISSTYSFLTLFLSSFSKSWMIFSCTKVRKMTYDSAESAVRNVLLVVPYCVLPRDCLSYGCQSQEIECQNLA